MRDIAGMVDALGGMAQKRQLVRLGARDADLTRAVRTAAVVRVRNGWYTTLNPSDRAVRAVRVGGRLTGLAAIADAGGWVLHRPRLQLAVPRNAGRLRSPWNRRRRRRASDPARVHWDADRSTGTAMRVGIPDALVCVILHEPLEAAVAAVDWAFSAGELDAAGWEAVLARLPASARGIRDWVDPLCQSLPESLSRTRLRMRGLRVRSQVPVAQIKAIDLLVEDAVGVEVDGEAFHRDRFASDRLKDLDISLLGLHAMRPSAHIVFHRWADLERAVLLALEARGVRPGPPPPLPGRARAVAAAAHRRRKLRRITLGAAPQAGSATPSP